MLEMIFSFKNNTDECREKLKSVFEKCRPASAEEKSGTVKIIFNSGSNNWMSVWPAVWRLTECEWFVSSVAVWELAVSGHGKDFKEDLLNYCIKNKKGLFGNIPK